MTDDKTPCRWCSQPPTSYPNPMCDEYGTPGPADVPVHCCACGETFELSDEPGAIYPLVNGICRPCWKLIRRPNHAIVAENNRLKEEIDNAYAERNAVVIGFARLAIMVGWRVGVLRDPAEPDWPVLMIDTHRGQVSWHFKADELPEGEFDPYPDPWDGHSTPEKYDRLAGIGFP